MKGGDGYIKQESTTVTKSIDGTESTKHETTRVQVSQADNAAKPAKVTVNTSPNGETTTSIDTGIPKDGAATKYAFDLLKVPMY
ncbi:MAG TPA: hypothetical protein PLD02_09440, partial [Saprospiraceae bacterium]|nr:hypothetical protein [Saprospiraceae bacterium]